MPATTARRQIDTPSRLTLRLAALLMFNGGRVPDEEMLQAAAAVSNGQRRSLPSALMKAMRPLIDLNVAVLADDDVWYAPSLPDLAAWVADGYEAREDDGKTDGVPVPVQRRAA